MRTALARGVGHRAVGAAEGVEHLWVVGVGEARFDAVAGARSLLEEEAREVLTGGRVEHRLALLERHLPALRLRGFVVFRNT